MRRALVLVLLMGCGGRVEDTAGDAALDSSSDGAAIDAASANVDTTTDITEASVDAVVVEDTAIDTFVPPDAPAVVDGSYVFPPCDDCVIADDAQSEIAVDDQYLYWATATTMRKTPLAGGPDVVLDTFDKFHTGVCDIALDATHVYWVTCGPSDGSRIRRAPLGGGPAQTVADDYHGESLVLDGDNVFVYDWLYGVRRVAKSGGKPMTVVASNRMRSAFARDGYLYYVLTYEEDEGVLLNPAELRRIPVTGGESVRVAEIGFPEPLELLAFDGTAQWADCGGHSWLHAVPIGGGAETTTPSIDGACQRVADGANLYVLGSYEIVRVSSMGTTSLATTGPVSWSPAVNSTHLFWAEPTTPCCSPARYRIRRVAK